MIERFALAMARKDQEIEALEIEVKRLLARGDFYRNELYTLREKSK